MQLASVDGLEGTTLGRLSTDLGMSKSSLQALFPSKLDLQLATIAAAYDVFASRVLSAPATTDPGLPSVYALLDAWIDYQGSFKGGCFFAAAAHEFDDHPGPVRDALRKAFQDGRQAVAEQLRLARRFGEITPDTNLDQLLFEVHGAILEANITRQFLADLEAPNRARRAIHDRLAHATNTPS
ncbi:TetR/AcrR family transcriptional regulator [Streptomyces chartreusis]|uniref:TetR/AcrR family transcriptional regulator n=1 Tax=Streptomyces chartreusis TaxID=1969 RepID=UPI003D71D1C4